jgi:RHS repeat-associated protein
MQTVYDRKSAGASGTSTTGARSDLDKPPNGQSSLPAISLPKGGGAIRGIGEKFGANPVTGTASASIPIFTSAGRSGFGPSLSLSYDSGSGNGPFGFGWKLSLPSITRKTEKGLPLYQDIAESDIFILSGSEDLVPELIEEGGKWRRHSFPRTLNIKDEDGTVKSVEFQVQRYRPRVEGLFAHIERWTNTETGEIHWRSISRDNITTLYGKTEESRISDPNDPSHIFSWLICESYDDRGDAIVYNYLNENSDGVDLTAAHEKNRSERGRSVNRYLKSIKYGNLPSRLVQPDLSQLNWMFEAVFDYGEHDTDQPTPGDTGKWFCRHDPFSSYRSGFEIRMYRLCQRVLMFHHFPNETDIGNDCLVRSTDFVYRNIRGNTDDYTKGHPIASFISSVTQSGYKRRLAPNGDNGYLKRTLPPVEFEYSQTIINEEIEEIDSKSLENLPYGIDGARYQLVDLDGEGVSGILTEQGNAWFYKPNLGGGTFGPIEKVAFNPSQSDLNDAGQKLMDLAGDGQLDLVKLSSPTPGFYERNHDQNWENFTPFESFPNLDWDDPNLRMVDLTGDGHADILVTENEALTWYPSLAERGFGPSSSASSTVPRILQSQDEELGPRLIFSDGTQSIYLADMSGDGLTDLVRLRNGEVCYWANIGYGRFGSKVTMDNSPWFDTPDIFDQSRIRLADIDGSGNTDIIYIGREDGVRLYFNESGNSWAMPILLTSFPHIDNTSSVMAVDLLGNGTVCLVWSSPLEGNTDRPMRYIDLMGGEKLRGEDGQKKRGQKPHLLISVKNNLGAETHVEYASSTKFYLADKAAGKPWITKLPFPVHVVEHVKTYDIISRNCFVTRYEYHHGYFDGIEREFRGFGLVENYDTEEFGILKKESDIFHTGDNIEESAHVPPVRTKTWFHTGIYVGRDRISNFFAGLSGANDNSEYYREPGLDPGQAQDLLLPDTELPAELTPEEEREACRALKGSVLRQEIYALDGTDMAQDPYVVTEQNYSIRKLQPHGDKMNKNRHAVFFTHSKEAITYHYERNPDDPRISHSMTLEVDNVGNVLKQANIGYGRRRPVPNPSNHLLEADIHKQTKWLVTYTENSVTNPIDIADDYRIALPCESRTYELTGDYTPNGLAGRFRSADFVQRDPDPNTPNTPNAFIHVFDREINYEDQPTTSGGKHRRLIEQMRTLYRKNDLTGLSSLRELESLALQGESYKLAFTPGLLAQVFQRAGQPLFPDDLTDPNNVNNVLGGQGGDQGGYVSSQHLKAEGKFPNTDPDNHWWLPNGQVFYSINSNDPPALELDFARSHFFLPHRYCDPFGSNTIVAYDNDERRNYNLLMTETRDPLGNRVIVGERKPNGQIDPNRPGNDYRVLQPRLVTDPNRNRTEALFDALGMVAGTAVKGKDDTVGDTLNDGFESDITQAQVDEFYDSPDPHLHAPNLLKGATTRIVYDLHRFFRTQEAHPEDPEQWLPVYAATLARETHVRDPLLPPPADDDLKIQISFSYSDGFGREIQKKVQAEPEPGTLAVVSRWVGRGWTIFNNKGKPVRQYEPFFSDLPPERRHHFEFGTLVGVSSILFYDPLERVVTTLYPNHTYEKIVFDPWKQESFDVNDTVTAHRNQTGDPRTDPDIHGYVAKYFAAVDNPTTWKTWFEQRQGGAKGPEEEAAANKASAHANTPTIVYFDTLGRPFLTFVHNRFERDTDAGIVTTVDELHASRVGLDIEGNKREIRDAVNQNSDAQGRIIIVYNYDMLGNSIHRLSMEAGARWMINDVTGKPIRTWDNRDHIFRTEYDPLRRPLRFLVTGADPVNPSLELLTERLVYGEEDPDGELCNLRGKLYLHLDQAGLLKMECHDFKGNPLRSSRRLAKQYEQAIDWGPVDDDQLAALEDALPPMLESLLESETFGSTTTYDALNRSVQMIAPHSDQPGTKRNVMQVAYNEAGLREQVHVWLDHPTEPEALIDPAIEPPSPVGVKNVEYNAKGQRKRIDYKNGVITLYDYDEQTFRLAHLVTLRDAASFPDDCPGSPPNGWEGCQVQNLHYIYDPVGNITKIRDDSQQSIFFRHKRVEPSAEYTYDAIYRLIEARGREHLGQVGGCPIPHSHNDVPRVGLLHPNDGNAMGTYKENYAYDAVGNLLEVHHNSISHPTCPDWSRRYNYTETSLIEDGTGGTPFKTSNRLSSTSIGNDNSPILEQYEYDPHGNMTRMPHLGGAHPDPNIRWDYLDQLCQTDLGGGGTAYYVYGVSGQRIRKVWQKSLGLTEERIYLGGFEIFRRRTGAEGIVTLERQTLHIMDDQQRIALVETRTFDSTGDDPAPQQLIRYQLGNHLGSASLELGDQAQIISYEEYTPYGSTSYQAVRKDIEVPLKRYRYTGKERDEETGFTYHGVRYYSPWLGRWSSADPAGIQDGPNLYTYVAGNPIRLVDPSGHQGKEPNLWLFEVEAFFQDVIATAKTRGYGQAVRYAFQNFANLWGYTGTVDVSDRDKPFFKTRQGDPNRVGPEPSGPNRERGAKIEGPEARAIRAAGGYTRVDDADPNAVKGRRFKRPPLNPVYDTPAMKAKPPAASTTPSPTPTPPPAPQPSPPVTQQQLELRFKEEGLSIRRQGGFARIGVMGFIAIAISGVAVIYSSDQLQEAIQQVKGHAVSFGVGALVFKLTRSAGAAGVVTSFMFWEGDSAPSEEEKERAARIERAKMIDEYIKKNYPHASRKVKTNVCHVSEYPRSEYDEIYSEIEFALDNPYHLEVDKGSAPQRERIWRGTMQ